MGQQQLDFNLEKEFDDILTVAKYKFRNGAEKHGIFNPDTDEVERLLEAENELIDVINYSLMEITKLRRLRIKIKTIKNKQWKDKQ